MVAIIEYGMGNVSSVQKALRKINMESVVTKDKGEITKANYIILPGVGSFNKAMQNLREYDLVRILREAVLENHKPFLGICLGMQLLATDGREDGDNEGLGFIEGTVKPIVAGNLPVPHMGWNEINICNSKYFSHTKDKNFYFVHSYWLDAKNKQDVSATVNYGNEITAVVQKNNILGTQFHPEKSQEEGIVILQSFFSINAEN